MQNLTDIAIFVKVVELASFTAAAVEFASAGIAVVEMEGGFEAWQNSNLPVEK